MGAMWELTVGVSSKHAQRAKTSLLLIEQTPVLAKVDFPAVMSKSILSAVLGSVLLHSCSAVTRRSSLKAKESTVAKTTISSMSSQKGKNDNFISVRFGTLNFCPAPSNKSSIGCTSSACLALNMFPKKCRNHMTMNSRNHMTMNSPNGFDFRDLSCVRSLVGTYCLIVSYPLLLLAT